MDKKCGNCAKWEQHSKLKHYDGGYPGHCNALFPLWVDYCWGPRHLDTVMYSSQDATACKMWEAQSDT